MILHGVMCKQHCCRWTLILVAAAGGRAAGEQAAFVIDGRPLSVRIEGERWQQRDGRLECGWVGNYLWAGRMLGAGDFGIAARLMIRGLRRSAASFCLGRSSHFGFEGAHGRIFVSGPVFGKARALGTIDAFLREGEPFDFSVERKDGVITFRIDGKLVHSQRFTGEVGWFGFRPWRSTMQIENFSASGGLEPLPPPRSQPTGYSIPLIDLSTELERQVVIARGTAEVYQGHPTTLLMPDGRTMFAVWTYDHGGACGPLKRSDDGGLTWSPLLPTPDNWSTVRNCPCIHRLVDPQGKARLFVFAGNGDMYQSVSENEGRTWSPMRRNGLHCVVAPITIEPISGGRLLALYHQRHAIYQSISHDGGLTWEPERRIMELPGTYPCEPAMIRSPDGRQMAALCRENRRALNSLLITTDDEGETWSPPRELPGSLTGDRHLPRYAADGRIVCPFRDVAEDSPTKGDFVAWVGTYEDLVHQREGQYRVRLLRSPKKMDLGYPGLEVLPDGTLVATTYAVLAEGEKNSVVSVRFKLEELDDRAKRLPEQKPLFVSGEGGYHTYRIPAVLTTGRGVVLAFCEGRKHSASDTGDIDIVMRRSLDGGQTWEPQRVIADDGPNTIGNPCPVVDRDTGTVWLLLTHNLGQDSEREITSLQSEGTRTVKVMKSDDDGATWTQPVDITASTKLPRWRWYATGPGIGIQLHTGRLVIPCDHSDHDVGGHPFRSHVIYSDDHGATWQLGGVVADRVNECQVVELSDGRLLLNMRSYHGRHRRCVAFSDDGGLTWSEPDADEALIEPVCQASLIATDVDEGRLLLFSNPAAKERREMTVRLSRDEGRTWSSAGVLHPGPSAYSCLVDLPGEWLGCLYERGRDSPYETITFARFRLDWLASTGAGGGGK